MRLTYDASIDAAYIYVVDEIAPGQAKTTVPVDGSAASVMLDFDDAGRLLGIEILAASHRLTPDVIAQAERR